MASKLLAVSSDIMCMTKNLDKISKNTYILVLFIRAMVQCANVACA